MTIFVKGESELAKKIRTNLAITFPLAKGEGTADKVILVEVSKRDTFAFDSIDTTLERSIFRFLRKATPLTIETHTAGGVQSEREVRILVPEGEKTEAAAEKAIQQGFLTLLNHKDIELSTVAVPVSADQVPQMRALLNEVFTQLCEVLSGTARDSGRDQAKHDYELLNTKIEARMQALEFGIKESIFEADSREQARQNERAAADAQFTARLVAADVQFKDEIREMLRVKGERNAGLWARLVAAWKNRVVVVAE